MKYFSNLSKYDEKGKRLAIFAEVDEESPTKLHIFILKCSKKDQFTKALARKVYEKYRETRTVLVVEHNRVYYHPNVISITIDNPATPKKCFLEWCNNNFFSYRKSTFQIYPFLIYPSNYTKLIDAKLSNRFVKITTFEHGSTRGIKA